MVTNMEFILTIQSPFKTLLGNEGQLRLHCLGITLFILAVMPTNSNSFISANSQPIWVKLWILYLMTNPEKVYDTTPNLSHFKSQLISTTCNPYISSKLSTDFVQTLDSTYLGQS